VIVGNPRWSRFPPPSRTGRLRLKHQISHRQKIDDVGRVIRLRDDQSAPAGDCRDQLAVVNWHRTAVGDVDHERAEWLRVIEIVELFDVYQEQPLDGQGTGGTSGP
jgi:hypothetical protein